MQSDEQERVQSPTSRRQRGLVVLMGCGPVFSTTRGIAPGVAPSVVTGALWRQAVRVYTRGRGSEMMP